MCIHVEGEGISVLQCIVVVFVVVFFFFSSRRRHTRLQGDWSSDVCSSDLLSELYMNENFMEYILRFFGILTVHLHDSYAVSIFTFLPKLITTN